MFMNRHEERHRSELWGLVLAAGDGRRLQSYVQELKGEELPKQYVNFIGRRSMLEHTFQRAEKLIPSEQILTIVARQHLEHSEVRRQLSSRPTQTIIVQPDNKETGAGILLPVVHLFKRRPEAIVALFPSDHFILEEDRFMNHVGLAAQAVAGDPSRIVLLAMEAQSPEVEYGYVMPGESLSHGGLWGTRRVVRFVEKPDAHLAQELVAAGGLWNTMIMVFKVKTLLEMARRIAPATYLRFSRILVAIGTRREADTIAEVYQSLEPMNFSKAFLEKASAIYPGAISVLPVLHVQWTDLGSRQRVVELQEKLEPPAHRALQAATEPQDVRKNSKTIRIANSASTKSNTCDCSFLGKWIFSHDLRQRGEMEAGEGCPVVP
jgi:mannose-1-phosphate guanylyltransferase